MIGSVLPATVTHIEYFGAFVDIGCGFISMIGIENISISRISHPGCRFSIGQHIFVCLTDFDRLRARISLSHKELLGTWEENAALFSPGMAVPGYVRGMKDYGVFIELTPNLTGLADYSKTANQPLKEDDRVSVYIKAIIPERRKIKLLLLHKLEPLSEPGPLRYYLPEGRVQDWHYGVRSHEKRWADSIDTTIANIL